MLKEESATEDEIFWNMAGTEDVISLQTSIKILFDEADKMVQEFSTIANEVDIYIDEQRNQPNVYPAKN